MSTSRMCIGGPADGLVVNGDYPYYSHPDYADYRYALPAAERYRGKVTATHYRAMPFGADGYEREVFTCLSPSETLRALLSGYRRP